MGLVAWIVLGLIAGIIAGYLAETAAGSPAAVAAPSEGCDMDATEPAEQVFGFVQPAAGAHDAEKSRKSHRA